MAKTHVTGCSAPLIAGKSQLTRSRVPAHTTCQDSHRRTESSREKPRPMDPGWPRTRAWLPRNNLVVPPNMELERTCDPATPLRSARPEEPVRDSNGHVQGGMFTIATGWKPPECPPIRRVVVQRRNETWIPATAGHAPGTLC